ncbi:efflux RND transporter periplasmic adaptor subunit [Candidatus Cyanaurora vandensis]|uniref:efflux RND transporter periplasmic adaptor subunit n=1 Tax=Candidatus Cyanaurora vandensis TaxID=2714958 RepID=UPI00257B8DE6|nr:efflux RND transporter periplasmic adaptor subunit [Candidatus Cyanaurora vandensis]
MNVAMNSVAKIPTGWRWLLGGLVVAGLAAGIYFVTAPRPDPAAKFERFLTVVEQVDTDIRITSAGQVFPNRRSNVGPKEGGLLAELFVEQGQAVKQGQILARMDTERVVNTVAEAKAAAASARAQYLKAQNGFRSQEVAQVQADLGAAQARLQIAQDNFQRFDGLYKDAGLTDEELNSRKLELERARADVTSKQAQVGLYQSGNRFEDVLGAKASYDRALANLGDAQTRFDDLTIRAPFTGIVSQRYAELGSYVSPTTNTQGASANSSSILLLIDRLEVLATVAESDIPRIKVGQLVRITSSAFPGQEFKGTVRLVAPEAVEENGITQFQVRVQLDDFAARTLKSRLNVSVNFIAGKLNKALVVPTTAIISKDGKTGILVPDLKKGPTYREVTTGQSLGDKTQILKGLKKGEQVFAKLPPDVNLEELLGKSNAFQ